MPDFFWQDITTSLKEIMSGKNETIKTLYGIPNYAYEYGQDLPGLVYYDLYMDKKIYFEVS